MSLCLAAAPAPFASACEHLVSLREGRATSRGLTDLYLDRIRRHNPALHAIVTHNETEARRTACERDDDLAHGIARGPLHGLPVTVKEAFNLNGTPTAVNVPHFKSNIAARDALVVTRLKEAGAIILGKTNVPPMLADYQTFGPLYPAANNPYDLLRTPGGSTGGGAAAVAAGLTTMEIGSDLGGSIRIPAHFCGVFGLKPTENFAVHGEGHVPPPPDCHSGFVAMAAIGPLARSMTDIELAWQVINQPIWHHPFHVPQKPRSKITLSDYKLAWFDNVGAIACGDETKTVLLSFLRLLEANGVHHEKQPFDSKWLQEAHSVWGVLLGASVGQHAPWIVRQAIKVQSTLVGRGSRMDLLGPWKAGIDLQFRAFSRALKQREDLIQDLHRRFQEYDFIVSPVAAGPAFRHNPKRRPIELDGCAMAYFDYTLPYTIIYNACGNPALTVPAGRNSEGLPIGLQIAATHYAEPELIHFGKLIEQLGVKYTRPLSY